MHEYKAPLRDLRFVFNELLDFEKHYATIPGGEDLNAEMIDAIFAEAAKIAEEVIAPINRNGDAGVLNDTRDREGDEAVIFYQADMDLIDVETSEVIWTNTKKIKKFIERDSVDY